jgi:hypothetical protein
MRSPRWMRSEKSLMMMGAIAEALGHMIGHDHGSWSCASSLPMASLAVPGAEHGGALGAHLVQLRQAALVALAPRGDAAFQPVRLDLQLGVELVGARASSA